MISQRHSRRKTKGSGMVEAALCLALLTPIAFTAFRLGYGVNQMHSVLAAAGEAAKAGATCASDEVIRQTALSQAPGLRPADVRIERVMEETNPGQKIIRVSIDNYSVERLSGPELLQQSPAAEFPYLCD